MGNNSKVILYARFSPRRDPEKTDSIQTQLTRMREACSERNWVIVDEFADHEVSGASSDEHKRAGLWGAIDRLKKGYVLMSVDPSRIARDMMLMIHVESEVKQKKGKIYCLDGWQNEDTPEAELFRRIMTAVKDYERKLNSFRSSIAMRTMQKSGRACGTAPFGWRCLDPDDDGKIMMEEDPREQACWKMMQKYRDEGITHREIAEKLNSMGMRNREGGEFHERSVGRLLRRRDLPGDNKPRD